LDVPPYDLDPKTGIFTPKEDTNVVAWPTNLSPFSSATPPAPPATQSRVLAERKQQVVRIPGDIGAEIKLEWFEFVDREAKSLYWSEVLRRKAWQTPQKEK
jgi:hypothetical protein